MDLADILGMPSGDAFCYGMCVECGTTMSNRRKAAQKCLCGSVPYYLREARTVGQILAAKREDDGYKRLREDIRQNGMDVPVLLYRTKKGRVRVQNGNHRLAAAAELGITVIPITYEQETQTEDWTDH
jgi:hypothetical protein